ncbi:MAG: hypothetical protein KGM99_17170 [Burkholderiales bacterium]|nr:hypothetical protein [Burkholderiales bacterium]
MSPTIAAPATATTAIQLDFKMAESILDRLGYELDDLSRLNGDVVIEQGEISHQLHYPSRHNAYNVAGHVWHENGLYYVSNSNYKTAEEAALEHLDRALVERTYHEIVLERSLAKDYD